MVRLLIAKNMVIDSVKKFFTKKEEGAALVEYGMLVGLIAVIAITALVALQTTIKNLYSTITTAL